MTSPESIFVAMVTSAILALWWRARSLHASGTRRALFLVNYFWEQSSFSELLLTVKSILDEILYLLTSTLLPLSSHPTLFNVSDCNGLQEYTRQSMDFTMARTHAGLISSSFVKHFDGIRRKKKLLTFSKLDFKISWGILFIHTGEHLCVYVRR